MDERIYITDLTKSLGDAKLIADRAVQLSNLYTITASQEAGFTLGPAPGKMK